MAQIIIEIDKDGGDESSVIASMFPWPHPLHICYGQKSTYRIACPLLQLPN